jgi:putative DNA primase/helicase
LIDVPSAALSNGLCDLPQFLDDWLFITTDHEITSAVATLGEVGLVSDTWLPSKTARRPNVKDRCVIIVGPSSGPGRKHAVKIAKEAIKAGAQCVRQWPLFGLGDEFADLASWRDKFDLADSLLMQRPWIAERADAEDDADLAIVEVDGETFNLTELGNAKRLVKTYRDRIRYCWAWKTWLIWDGKRWRPDDTGEVYRLAKSTIQGIASQAAACDDKAKRRRLWTWALKSETRRAIEHMVVLAQSEPGIAVTPDLLDQNGWLFNVQNGTLNLRTGKLFEHRREDLITRIAPTIFDPDAKCALWEKTLGRVFEKLPDNPDGEPIANDQLIGFIRRLFGMCLTADVSEQILPIFYGSGANGKSTILGMILKMMGDDYAITAPPGLLVVRRGEAHPTERAVLFGKRFVADMESAEDARLNENLVKQLTGSDQIEARRMRENFWSFQPTHKLVMCTNHRPVIRETKNAIWRRVKLVPFAVEIPEIEQVKDLPRQLANELPGILAWCVRGCLEWQAAGLKVPEEVDEATQSYRNDQDILGQFIAEECTTDSSLFAKATPIYQRFTQWTQRTGEPPMSQKAFGSALGERGFERYENHGKCYRGIGLRASGDDESRGSE